MFKEAKKHRVLNHKLSCSIAMMFIICFTLTLACNSPSNTQTTFASDASNNSLKVLKKINSIRTQRGLTALSSFASLEDAANERAKELTDSFSHNRPNGDSCFTILDDYDIEYRACGENIAVGQQTADEVCRDWMNSEGHRKNILSKNFLHLGVGYIEGGEYAHNWSQEFVGGCKVESMKIIGAKKYIRVKKGTTLAKMNLTLRISCDMHGYSRAPITTNMCTGYRRNKLGKQKVKIYFANKVYTQRFNVVRKK